MKKVMTLIARRLFNGSFFFCCCCNYLLTKSPYEYVNVDYQVFLFFFSFFGGGDRQLLCRNIFFRVKLISASKKNFVTDEATYREAKT